jgi:hypothetical protein
VTSLPPTTSASAGNGVGSPSAGNGAGAIDVDAPSVSTAPVDAVVAGLAEEFGGTRLLVSDVRTAFLLVNRARHLAIQRVFGLSAAEDNLLTFVVAVMAANAVRDNARRLILDGPVPSAADWLFGSGSLRELLCSVAGPAARDTPQLGTLLTIAVVAAGVRPVVAKSLHGIRSSSHRMTVGFHHRYGYLIDPGHRRERRAQRREAQASNGGFARPKPR